MRLKKKSQEAKVEVRKKSQEEDQVKVELIVDEMEAACSAAKGSSRQVTSGIKK